MKRWSLLIATIAGTEVRIHATFLLLVVFMAAQAMRIGGTALAVESIAFLLLAFTCVLLHEFGHVFAARRYGIRTPDITLLPIGGLARLERMPKEPLKELVVAVAGPAVNVVIFFLISVVFQVRFANPIDVEMQPSVATLFGKLAVWNLLMVAFNMIPAFPMDGGRVLRALLAMTMKNYARATRLAAGIGQTIAVAGAVVGILFFHQGIIFALIALFIFLSAGDEAAYVTERESMRGLLVRDAMMTNFQSLTTDAKLQHAVEMLLAGTQHDFPVLNREGEYVGLLKRNRLISALAEHGVFHPVAEVIDSGDAVLSPYERLGEALDQLRESGHPVLPVMDPVSGILCGLLSKENIGEMLMVRHALQEGRGEDSFG